MKYTTDIILDKLIRSMITKKLKFLFYLHLFLFHDSSFLYVRK